LRGLGLRDSVAAGTFHGIAYAQLRRYWADKNRTAPGLLERKASVVARVLPPAVCVARAHGRGLPPLRTREEGATCRRLRRSLVIVPSCARDRYRVRLRATVALSPPVRRRVPRCQPF